MPSELRSCTVLERADSAGLSLLVVASFSLTGGGTRRYLPQPPQPAMRSFKLTTFWLPHCPTLQDMLRASP